MDITIRGDQRARLRAELQAHRARSTLNDADYARLVLKISLNTFKKCLGPTAELTLKAVPTAQTLTFPSRTTTKVRMTIIGVQKGSDPAQNDLCISEARFAE